MAHILCKISGHVHIDPAAVAEFPWESSDFRGRSVSEFTEPNCLRCGSTLERKAA